MTAKSKGLDITVLVDEWTVQPGDPHFTKQPDKPMTEFHVADALRHLGHSVSAIGVSNDVAALAGNLKERKCDLVFNLTEQIGGDRLMDKNIAGILEIMGIPYTGSGPMGLMLSRDKRLCKQLLSLHRIRVPNFVSLPIDRKIKVPKPLKYPLVVKPAFEDGSEGISNASLVANEKALEERVRYVHGSWQQPVIAEEYVEGREFYVSVIGNRRLSVLPIRECKLGSGDSDGPMLATYSVKYNEKYREKWNIEFGFAELDPDLVRRIERTCKNVYRILHLRDYGRLDLRVTPEGRITILECNPNPDLAFGEEVAESAERAGTGYEKLIDKIIRLALARYE